MSLSIDCKINAYKIYSYQSLACLGYFLLLKARSYYDGNVTFLRWIELGLQSNFISICSGGSRIFPRGGREPSRGGVNTPNFPENCMKSKEFGRPGGGVRPSRPPRSANDMSLLFQIKVKIELSRSFVDSLTLLAIFGSKVNLVFT